MYQFLHTQLRFSCCNNLLYPDNSPKDSERVLDFSTVKQTKGSGNKASYPDLCKIAARGYPRASEGNQEGQGGKQTIRTRSFAKISSPYELLLKSKSRCFNPKTDISFLYKVFFQTQKIHNGGGFFGSFLKPGILWSLSINQSIINLFISIRGMDHPSWGSCVKSMTIRIVKNNTTHFNEK